jgi:hypothetical protein
MNKPEKGVCPLSGFVPRQRGKMARMVSACRQAATEAFVGTDEMVFRICEAIW